MNPMKNTFRLSAFVMCVISFCTPSLAAAAINMGYVESYSDSIISIINDDLVPTLFAIAFIVFLWGVVKYFFIHGDQEAEREKGRWFILWGLIGFVVILSVWGLVTIVGTTLGLPTGAGTPIPPIFNTGPEAIHTFRKYVLPACAGTV